MTDITTKLRSFPPRKRSAVEAADEIDSLRAALLRLLNATEGHDVCPYAKAEVRYVLPSEMLE